MKDRTDSIEILGIPFSPMTREEARIRLSRMIEEEASAAVFTPNPHMLMEAHRDPSLAALLKSAALLLPDGVGVTVAARLRGAPLPARITGIDTAEWLLSYGERNGLRFYFLGGETGVAQKAAERMKKRYPNLTVTGCHHGYFQKSGRENEKVLAEIQAASPHILFVCLGFPLQERWIAENLPSLPSVRIAMGLGGVLDVWSGSLKRAPALLQALGLEWLWRTLQSPKKRLKALKSLPPFLLLSLKQK